MDGDCAFVNIPLFAPQIGVGQSRFVRGINLVSDKPQLVRTYDAEVRPVSTMAGCPEITSIPLIATVAFTFGVPVTRSAAVGWSSLSRKKISVFGMGEQLSSSFNNHVKGAQFGPDVMVALAE